MVGFVEFLGAKLAGKDGEVATEIALTRKTAVFFVLSAHGVHLAVSSRYNSANGTRPICSEGFEIVFISGDKDEKTFVEYFGEMP